MLTADQLAAIDRHLRKDNWLLNEELIAELTDHYANAVTEAMEQGQSFDNALAAVHHSFGGRKGLLAMEETYILESQRKPVIAYWQCLRTYFTGRKAFIPLLLIIGLAEAAQYQNLLQFLTYVAYSLLSIKMLWVIIWGLKLVVWKNTPSNKIAKKLAQYLPGSYVPMYLLFMYTTNVKNSNPFIISTFLFASAMDWLVAFDLLFRDKDFRQWLRLNTD